MIASGSDRLWYLVVQYGGRITNVAEKKRASEKEQHFHIYYSQILIILETCMWRKTNEQNTANFLFRTVHRIAIEAS